jgi:hypothetical protein
MMARLQTMTRQWLFPVLGALALVGTVMGDATDSPFDIVENQYQDGFKGATGYLPVFHPTPLTAAETTSARVAIYRTTPDPANVSLEFPGPTSEHRVLRARLRSAGPYAQPPQPPYLIPGNIAVIAFGDAKDPRRGHVHRHLACRLQRHRRLSGQPQNLRPSAGPGHYPGEQDGDL